MGPMGEPEVKGDTNVQGADTKVKDMIDRLYDY